MEIPCTACLATKQEARSYPPPPPKKSFNPCNLRVGPMGKPCLAFTLRLLITPPWGGSQGKTEEGTLRQRVICTLLYVHSLLVWTRDCTQPISYPSVPDISLQHHQSENRMSCSPKDNLPVLTQFQYIVHY